jgi:hypothetical protein
MPLGRSGKTGATEMKWAHHLVVYADHVKLVGDNIDTIKKNTETVIDASEMGSTPGGKGQCI